MGKLGAQRNTKWFSEQNSMILYEGCRETSQNGKKDISGRRATFQAQAKVIFHRKNIS